MSAAPTAVPMVCGPLSAMLVADETRPCSSGGVTRCRRVVKATITQGMTIPTTTSDATTTVVLPIASKAKAMPSRTRPIAIAPRSPTRAMTAAAVRPPSTDPPPWIEANTPKNSLLRCRP